MGTTRTVKTAVLEIAYEESGPPSGPAAVLLHGYPYDVRAYDGVVPILNASGVRTIVPHLRGHGPTRFLSDQTMRSGEQAAIGQDAIDLVDALGLKRAVFAGFDWGARAACVAAAVWPERVDGLLTCGGYQIQDISKAARPADPEQEMRFWYQWYFHTERGRNALRNMRAPLSKLLWKLWSPTWAFDDATFERSAVSLDNPDYVDVVIHSYEHRNGQASGDPNYTALEAQLSKLPKISVPTIVIHGADDGVQPPYRSEHQERFYTAAYERLVPGGVGHNPPQEDAAGFAEAVLRLVRA